MKNKSLIRIIPLMAVLIALPLSALANRLALLPEDVFPPLRQILADAAAQSPDMVASNLELLAADGALQQAKAGLYPAVFGSYQLTQTRDQREDIPGTLQTDKNYYNLALSQPLFHWGERRNNARIGEIRRQIADENYQEAYRLIVQQIRSSYLQLVLGKIAVKNAIYNHKLADDALVSAEDRLSKKLTTEGAIFQIRIGAEKAKLDQEDARWRLEVLKQNFALLTGGSPLTDDQIPNGIPGLSSSQDQIDHLLAQFLADDDLDTATARIHRKQLEIDELYYKNQRTRLRPKLDFIAGISQDEQSYSTNIAQKYGLQSHYLGLRVSWNIFDGFASRGAVASALAQKRIGQLRYRQLTAKLSRDAQNAAKEAQLAFRQLALSERLLESASNFLEHTQTYFERGQTSEAEVQNAQVSYNKMSSEANSSRYIYLLRVSEFLSLIAEDPTVKEFGHN